MTASITKQLEATENESKIWDAKPGWRKRLNTGTAPTAEVLLCGTLKIATNAETKWRD